MAADLFMVTHLGHRVSSLLNTIEHYQHKLMLHDDLTDDQLTLLKVDLKASKISHVLGRAEVTNPWRGAPLFRLDPEQVRMIYDSVEKAQLVVEAFTTLTLLLDQWFTGYNRSKSWLINSKVALERFKKGVVKSVPVKYREEVLGLLPQEKAVKKLPQVRNNYWYLHLLDGRPAIFDGRAIVYADRGKVCRWPSPTSLKQLMGERELVLSQIKSSMGIKASAQFEARLSYTGFMASRKQSTPPILEQEDGLATAHVPAIHGMVEE